VRQTRKQGNNLFIDNININGSVIGMNAIAAPKTQQVRLYPNPSSRQVTVTIDHATADDVNITLFDQTGKLIRQQQQTVQSGNNSVPLAIDQLPNGIYFVVVQSNTLYHSEKLVVLH
ncbi:MAG TPA: T9SS type A sorting domain-containing protein, partial [Chitinophagales bacterium]|nr:T9SS type A sorting domain-containing protein [Chitinophagales bacterium]